MYDLLVFIGRFQPLHLGHQAVIESARLLSKRVLVLVGGKGKARSSRNPFTFDERKSMIQAIYPDVLVEGIADHTYNDDAWILEVQQTVKAVARGENWNALGLKDMNIGLIGCDKDHTSYYLHLFPDWASEAVEHVSPLNATAIRKEIYDGSLEEHLAAAVMDVKTAKWLFHTFMHTPEYEQAKKEHFQAIEYVEKWGYGPHLTADALVQAGGNILLVTRGGEHGFGKLALPGGFLNKHEKFLDGALRELREETKLKVPRPVLKGSIVGSFMADDPHRSERGRIVTMCQHIKLTQETSLPEVRGSDDAKHADWYPIADLVEADFFEDHYHIIKKVLGL